MLLPLAVHPSDADITLVAEPVSDDNPVGYGGGPGFGKAVFTGSEPKVHADDDDREQRSNQTGRRDPACVLPRPYACTSKQSR